MLLITERYTFNERRLTSITDCCVPHFLSQEPRAFPNLPEFNAEDELNSEDLEPIYNGELTTP